MCVDDYLRAVQAGNCDRLPELWAGVRGFVAQKAMRKMRAYQYTNTDAAVDMDDLIQEGFIAMLEAAETFQPDRGMSFLGWLDLHLKTAFNNALGLRRLRDLHDPIHQRGSLSRTIQLDGDGGTLAEFAGDGGEAIDGAEREIWLEQLRAALERSAAELSPMERRALSGRYCLELTLQQIAAAEGVSHQAISYRAERAIQRIRRGAAAEELAEFAGQL